MLVCRSSEGYRLQNVFVRPQFECVERRNEAFRPTRDRMQLPHWTPLFNANAKRLK